MSKPRTPWWFVAALVALMVAGLAIGVLAYNDCRAGLGTPIFCLTAVFG